MELHVKSAYMELTEPLPCKCGGSTFVDWWKSFQGEEQVFVRCSKCGSFGKDEETEEQAVESWNKEINDGLQENKQEAG